MEIKQRAEYECVELLAEAFKDWFGSWSVDLEIQHVDFLDRDGVFDASVTHKDHGSFIITFKYTAYDGLRIKWREGLFTKAEPKYIFYILWLNAIDEIDRLRNDH